MHIKNNLFPPIQNLRTRLAPTPSGYLHIGNALSFVVTWALARAQSGWILLRIDDLDASRRRPEYLEDIFRTIDWLGIDYDQGPTGPTDFLHTYSQQLRLDLYGQAIEQLRAQDHLYACTCSRKEIQAASMDGNYPGTCREKNLDFQRPKTAWRVKVPAGTSVRIPALLQENIPIALSTEMGDFVIRQKNGAPAYQVASLVEDDHWKINFIVRGEDLRPSTAAQLYLAKLLGLSGFQAATFWHHGLIKSADGQKLSKSAGADALKSWREAGKDPADIFELAARWLGIESGPVRTAEALAERMAGRLGDEERG